jgi:hypothetical protein
LRWTTVGLSRRYAATSATVMSGDSITAVVTEAGLVSIYRRVISGATVFINGLSFLAKALCDYAKMVSAKQRYNIWQIPLGSAAKARMEHFL